MTGASHNPPRISIGMVVYNGARHIRRALDSMAEQSYQNIELVVIDGGSTDGTLAILREHAEHISALVCEPDRGIYDAMNKACALATGDWLLFMGCDDVLLDVLGEVVPQMTNPRAVYYGDVVFRHSGEVYGGKFSRRRMARQNICHQAVFYPRSAYARYRYCLDYEYLADYAYNMRLMGDSVPFLYLGRVISIFNEQGSASRADDNFARDRLALYREAFGEGYFLLESLRRTKGRIVAILAKLAKMLLQGRG